MNNRRVIINRRMVHIGMIINRRMINSGMNKIVYGLHLVIQTRGIICNKKLIKQGIGGVMHNHLHHNIKRMINKIIHFQTKMSNNNNNKNRNQSINGFPKLRSTKISMSL